MSFFDDYKLYTSATEIPGSYNIYSALAAMSSFASGKVWVNMGYYKIFPNLYIVLVGPPGGGKTSAMGICKRLINAVNSQETPIPLSSSCPSAQALMLEMRDGVRAFEYPRGTFVQYSPLTVCVTELSNFIGQSGPAMIEFLTTIYDEPYYKYKTKNKGECEIQGPYLTVLACTPHDWITARLREDVISGGFSRRALFVLEAGRKRKGLFPIVTQEIKDAWARLVTYGKSVARKAGEFTWEDGVQAWFDSLYMAQTQVSDPIIGGYYECRHVQAVKIAMLLSLGESLDFVLRRRHLEGAFEILGLVEANLLRVFEGIGRNELNAVANQIQEHVRRAGGSISDRELRSAMFRCVNDTEYDEIMRHLVQTKKVGLEYLNGITTIKITKSE